MKSLFHKFSWVVHYFSWIFRYARLMFGLNTLKDIKILSIEFCSICNLHCRYCFIEKLERPKFLDINIYEKLIKEVSENSKYNIKVIEWPISGEFLVYPEYKKVIEITKKYMDQNPRFRPYVILNENLVLLNEERIDLILSSGVVKQIICSVDGYDRESFERMRPPAKFETMIKNIKLLFQRNQELGSPVYLQINNGRDEDSLGHEYSKEMKEIFYLIGDARFWKPKHWNESFNRSDKKYFPAKGFCTFVFNNVTLSASGQVSKCCMDLKGATGYADFSKDTLTNIWHSQVRKQFLGMMFRNKRKLLKGCGTCAITNTNNDNRATNIFRTFRRFQFMFLKRLGAFS